MKISFLSLKRLPTRKYLWLLILAYIGYQTAQLLFNDSSSSTPQSVVKPEVNDDVPPEVHDVPPKVVSNHQLEIEPEPEVKVESAPEVNDIFEQIKIETNLVKLQELNRQIQARINDIKPKSPELRPNIGIEKRKIEPIKADVFPGQSIRGPDNPSEDDPNRPEGFNLDSLQEKAEKIQANMNTRRSTAGAVVVRYHLEPTKIQIFLRCSDQKLDMRRKSFRDHFSMWQNSDSQRLDASYLFIMERPTEPWLQKQIDEENEFFNDIYQVSNIKIYNATSNASNQIESDFSLFIESMKLAGHGTEYPAVIPKSMGAIQTNNKTVNLFIKDTDIVNYDTIRQAFYQMTAFENPEQNMMTFSGLRRDVKTHIPFTGNKISVRADLMNMFWTKISAQVNEPSFTSLQMEGRLSRINGRARLAVPIRGIVSNRVMEAIMTIPYELPEYQKFNNLFAGWIQDHQPSSLMSMELPDSYLKKRESNWETDLVLAPPCGESKILSLVKTSRKDSKLRGLTRLTYSLDLRRDDLKTGDYPTLRFILGKKGTEDEDSEIEKNIQKEIDEHGDIIIGDFLDTYDNLPLKTLTGYKYLNDTCPATVKWIMFHDDDALINLEKAIKFFDGPTAKKMNCFGFLGENSRPHRWGKYNVTQLQWESGHYFPQFCSGPCNGLSRESAQKIFETAKETETNGFRLEDVLFLGIIREKAKMEIPHFEKGICQHFDQMKEKYMSTKIRFYLKSHRKNEEEIRNILGEYYVGINSHRRPPVVGAIAPHPG